MMMQIWNLFQKGNECIEFHTSCCLKTSSCTQNKNFKQYFMDIFLHPINQIIKQVCMSTDQRFAYKNCCLSRLGDYFTNSIFSKSQWQSQWYKIFLFSMCKTYTVSHFLQQFLGVVGIEKSLSNPPCKNIEVISLQIAKILALQKCPIRYFTRQPKWLLSVMPSQPHIMIGFQ